MNLFPCRIRPMGHGVIFLFAVALLTACGDSDAPQAGKSADTPKPAATAQASAQTQSAIPAVNACTLLSSAEVEAVSGRKTAGPVEEHTSERMSYCYFGEPDSRTVLGRPQSTVAKLSVLSGGNDYFGGPVAQVNETFDHWAKDNSELELVDGPGERAHWQADFDTLRVVRGAYLLEVEVSERDMHGEKIAGQPRKIAEQLAKAALQKLP